MRITRGHTISFIEGNLCLPLMKTWLKYTATYLLGILTTLLLIWVFRYRVVAIIIYMLLK